LHDIILSQHALARTTPLAKRLPDNLAMEKSWKNIEKEKNLEAKKAMLILVGVLVLQQSADSVNRFLGRWWFCKGDAAIRK
jgi:alkylhydroperoxidase/carboxymuconolactone decarboxylase family protein YurZ